MVSAPEGGESVYGPAAQGSGEFAVVLKGWRSQLRWAMTQRDEDPARVWLEVISIDERSKRALAGSPPGDQLDALTKFRSRLESSIAALAGDLGDENVAPLYSWIDLVRQRRRLAARVDEARGAVAQARAVHAVDGRPAPGTEEEATEQLARAQAELDVWRRGTPPAPPPEVLRLWEAEGGEALFPSLSQEPAVVASAGTEARTNLARAAGRRPGVHPWVRSRAELIAIPTAGAVAVLATLFAITGAEWAFPTAVVGIVCLGLLVGWSVYARAEERVERAAAVAWAWHHALFEGRGRLADLEVGWLRTLVEAEKALRLFDAKAGSGGQLRDFEKWRPDLAEMVHEVARDTEDPS